MEQASVQPWRNTAQLLRAAMAELPDDDPARDSVKDWLSHNELGLAFDELTAAGVDAPATSAFWNRLSEAAKAMKLTTDDSVARTLRFPGPGVRQRRLSG